jgi:hypothetical protein
MPSQITPLELALFWAVIGLQIGLPFLLANYLSKKSAFWKTLGFLVFIAALANAWAIIAALGV